MFHIKKKKKYSVFQEMVYIVPGVLMGLLSLCMMNLSDQLTKPQLKYAEPHDQM